MGKGSGGPRKPPGAPDALQRPSLPPQPQAVAEAEPATTEHLKGSTKGVTVYLPEALHRQLKREAFERSEREGEQISVSKIIVEALTARGRFTQHGDE